MLTIHYGRTYNNTKEDMQGKGETVVTINEIAALANVSKSTVSRVINGSANVNEQTRKRVLKIIQNNDYIPSAMARGLSSKNSNVIGWILPETDSIFFGQVTQGIYDALADTHYTFILSCTNNDYKRELKALQNMRQQNIRGLLITSSSGYSDDKSVGKIKKAIADLSIPVVLVDRSVENTSFNGVYSDNYNGAYELTEALINARFTEIGGFFSDMKLNLGRHRYEGFLKALHDNQMAEKMVHLEDGPALIQNYYEITCQMADEGKLPKAVLLSNGVIACGFFRAIIEKGLVPGKDIHCVCFDHLEALEITGTPYSYLKRNCKLFGQTAVKMLLNAFSGDSSVREECIVTATLELHKTLANP